MTWFLDLRALPQGGGVADEVQIFQQANRRSADDLLAAVAGQDVLFVTHGFNVDRAQGRQALGNWESWQSLPPSVVYIGVLWPGDSVWLPGIDYAIEGNEAIATGDHLADFILDKFQIATSLNFASHSLGARVVLQTIQKIAESGRRHPPIRRLLLMAGAIDDTCLSGEYARAAQAVADISVLASYHDAVLALAFPLGNLAAGVFTRGCPYWHAALGREGPPSTLGGKVSAGWQIPNPWDYGHGDYLPQQPPAVAALRCPQCVPPLTTPAPTNWTFAEWRAAWSAAILSTRYR
ncbi:MAG: alpha/beta hydrolase [Acidibrevibacterium sp.]|jgi:hypothetical protein|uniref:alpha/beta hydrolase n=1 Tax=Acidibrevibacterium fodinaquatile TaxID=1969806 RepID=UPI0023A88E99|nr:alpha/beta hydrolase [Acidibrevibacterium fodinaquatile]MCA7120558.1 alpha/beta hydrolase [Acidibrevibacterium fodinaquatile]